MAARETQDCADSRPDFRHVRDWIFDLDNTLYRADTAVFDQIDARMTRFIAEYLKIDPDAARALQKRYYREHGTTLGGLMRLHGIDPEAYLDYVHAIDLGALVPEQTLIAAVTALPGRRFVFTNGCRRHAGRVLDRIGLGSAFDDIWDIRTLGFHPKPESAAYDAVGAFCRPWAQCAMFDDLPRNLVPAHERGMTTVWLDGGAHRGKDGPDFPIASATHIHHETRDLASFLQTIRT